MAYKKIFFRSIFFLNFAIIIWFIGNREADVAKSGFIWSSISHKLTVEKYLNRLYIEGTCNPAALSTLQGILPISSVQEVFSNIPDRFASPNIRGELPMAQRLNMARIPEPSSQAHDEWIPWLTLLASFALMLGGFLTAAALWLPSSFTAWILQNPVVLGVTMVLSCLALAMFVFVIALFPLLTIVAEYGRFHELLANLVLPIARWVLQWAPPLFLCSLSLVLLMQYGDHIITVHDWKGTTKEGVIWESFSRSLPLWCLLLLSLLSGSLALVSKLPGNLYGRRALCSLYSMLYPYGGYFLIQGLIYPSWIATLLLVLLAASIILVPWKAEDLNFSDEEGSIGCGFCMSIIFVGIVSSIVGNIGISIGSCIIFAWIVGMIVGWIVGDMGLSFGIFIGIPSCIIFGDIVSNIVSNISDIVIGIVVGVYGGLLGGVLGGGFVGIFVMLGFGAIFRLDIIIADSLEKSLPIRFQICRWFFPLFLSFLWLIYAYVHLVPC